MMREMATTQGSRRKETMDRVILYLRYVKKLKINVKAFHSCYLKCYIRVQYIKQLTTKCAYHAGGSIS
jgi:hypothetical protein